MPNQPIIGITLDAEKPGGYSSYPWYALRENYAESIRKHGAIPIMLPHEPTLAAEYLNIIDGLLLTGGDFDIDPSMYGAATKHATVTTKNKRTAFEVEILRGALAANMPIVGICAGEQLLNVMLGGTLVQHIPDEIENPLQHEQRHLGITQGQPSHSVTVIPNTLLHRITGRTDFSVNSSHHQAVKTVGERVIVNAVAPDGVIEGIEYTRHPFCLGLEWHPEYDSTESDTLINKAFVEAAREYKGKVSS